MSRKLTRPQMRQISDDYFRGEANKTVGAAHSVVSGRPLVEATQPGIAVTETTIEYRNRYDTQNYGRIRRYENTHDGRTDYREIIFRSSGWGFNRRNASAQLHSCAPNSLTGWIELEHRIIAWLTKAQEQIRVSEEQELRGRKKAFLALRDLKLDLYSEMTSRMDEYERARSTDGLRLVQLEQHMFATFAQQEAKRLKKQAQADVNAGGWRGFLQEVDLDVVAAKTHKYMKKNHPQYLKWHETDEAIVFKKRFMSKCFEKFTRTYKHWTRKPLSKLDQQRILSARKREAQIVPPQCDANQDEWNLIVFLSAKFSQKYGLNKDALFSRFMERLPFWKERHDPSRGKISTLFHIACENECRTILRKSTERSKFQGCRISDQARAMEDYEGDDELVGNAEIGEQEEEEFETDDETCDGYYDDAVFIGPQDDCHAAGTEGNPTQENIFTETAGSSTKPKKRNAQNGAIVKKRFPVMSTSWH